MTNAHYATSLGAAPEAERHIRMVKYSLAMGLRLVCIGACFLVSGWWLLLPAFGAVLLPYVAVVVANSVAPTSSSSLMRPGTLTLVDPK